MPERRSLRRMLPKVGAVLTLMLLALALRALGFETVFLGDAVVFPPADAQYHLRRALYTFAGFPQLLLFDAYINYPGGASVPWPPLYDVFLGSVARLLADDVRGFEVVAAWVPPFLGASAIIPIYLSGRRLDSPGLGLVAGLFYALLPINVWFARVGNTDHHVAVATIGAWLLYAWLRAMDPGESRWSVWSAAALLFAVRSCLLLTWHGSLLYLTVADGLLLATAAVSGRRPLLWIQLTSGLACAGLIAPVLLLSPPPLGGHYSAIALSWLHVLAVASIGFVSAGLLIAERHRPGRGALARLGVLLLVAAAVLGAVLLLPGPRAGLEPALQFLTMTDDVGARTGEQLPLFRMEGRVVGLPAKYSWGYFAYLIPLAPIAAWWIQRRPGATPAARASALPLAAWGAVFGALTISQQRYGNDFAPVASLLFAIALLAAGRVLSARLAAGRRGSRLAVLIASLLCVGLEWPAIADIFVPRLRSSLVSLEAGPPLSAQLSVAATLTRFCREVRRLTPETASYLEPGPEPEYGIIAPANIGHALQYVARRPTATDPFWAYIGRENWERSAAFHRSRSEREALDHAAALEGRYVVTLPGAARGTIVNRLHNHDGRSSGDRSLGHFRLLTEAPRGGASIQAIFGHGSGDLAPYKLFEIVRGAVLEVRAEPGRRATASVDLVTPGGRAFLYRNGGRVGADGLARITLPYPTDADAPPGARGGASRAVTAAQGPYRVRVGSVERTLRVSGAAVRAGERIEIDLPEAAGR
jgi:asparagine N-glycosylation enzyme membrane subunit Stt3